MYAKSLVDVGKLIYLVGNFSETAQMKKVLESSDGKSRIFYKCVEEIPQSTFKKIKYPQVREGIIRSDWLHKIIDRYPEMVIFQYNCADDTYDLQKIESLLKDFLKKINIFYADYIKVSNKEDVVIRIIVTVTKQQFANSIIQERIIYYLKTYEKDVFIIQNELLAKQVGKYRNTWLGYLEKNYEKKYKKLLKKSEQAATIQKRICFAFKVAIYSQILNRDEKIQYINLYNAVKYKFSEVTKKEFNFIKYLEIKELRIIADTTLLRYIKYKIGNNVKQIPEFVNGHLNAFKMRNMEPNNCHFYFYFQQLLWRSTFIENVLQVLYSSQVMQLLPHVVLAQLINGLLSYLHKLSTTTSQYLQGIQGKVFEIVDEIYMGKLNNNDITDVDLVTTGITNIILHRKDFIMKGVQIITRYKTSGLFKQNEINLLNIYLIRFYLADGKFSSIISIYNEILKVEVNRCNYFLINQLFNQIKSEMNNIDVNSRALLYGVASLICDFFENKNLLNNYLIEFFNLFNLQQLQKQPLIPQITNDLFAKELSPQVHIFKLKKNSSIFTLRIIINQQIIMSEQSYKIKVKITLNDQIRYRVKKDNSKLQLKFNQPNMIHESEINISELDGDIIQREFVVQPLHYIRKDAILKIEQVHLIMQKKSLVWLLQKSQIIFQRFDSTLFYCKIQQPVILIQSLKKVYYINQTAYFNVIVQDIDGCKVTSKFSIFQEDDGKTEFFMNIRDKKDLTNSKFLQELIVSGVEQQKNLCWIKCNKLGSKTLKLQFNSSVEKTIKVSWREKPLNLKMSYNTVKEIKFTVINLFSITKVFRQALTGNSFDNNIPLNKKILLCFYIKPTENIIIKELGHHNNPRKIKYLKNIKMTNTRLSNGQNLKVNLLFEINQDCQNQLQLFLTTLFIKWNRIDNVIPVDNIFLDDETKINAINDRALITFEQKTEIIRRKKTNLYIKIQNLTKNPININAFMDSTENILRIGEKNKTRVLPAFERTQIGFEVLSIHSGIFDFPPIRVFINNSEIKLSTNNFLVYCT